MAENGSGGGWWSGLIQVAKEKSASAVEFVRKDLSEFTNTMQNDTNVVATELKSSLTHENAVVATQRAKQGVTQLFGGISKALSVEAEDLKKPGQKQNPHSKHIFDRAQARINAIQIDPETYCEDPSGSKEKYDEWVKSFNLEQRKGDISELLVVNVEVRALYTQLVPSQVAHADFWQRYFYKLHQLSLDDKRKADLMKRADDVQEDFGWDDDDDWGDLDDPSSPPHSSDGMSLAAKALSCEDEDQAKCSITSNDWGDLDGPSSPPHSSDGMNLAAKALSCENNKEDEDQEKCSITSSDVSDGNKTEDSEEQKVEDNEKIDTAVKEVQDVTITKPISHEICNRDVISTEDNADKSDGAFNMDNLKASINDELKDNKVVDIEDVSTTQVTQQEAITSPISSITDESSLNISSITDNSLAKDTNNKIPMESSTDTLTLVSPLRDETPVDSIVDVAPKGQDPVSSSSVPTQSVSEQVSTASIGNDDSTSTSSMSDIQVANSMNSEPSMEQTNEPKELKIKVKGDLVVVGSGASSSSDGTTPSSTSSSNKEPETEDDWEKEFEVTEEDLLHHHIKITVAEKKEDTSETKVEPPNVQEDEMEGDWESWD